MVTFFKKVIQKNDKPFVISSFAKQKCVTHPESDRATTKKPPTRKIYFSEGVFSSCQDAWSLIIEKMMAFSQKLAIQAPDLRQIWGPDGWFFEKSEFFTQSSWKWHLYHRIQASFQPVLYSRDRNRTRVTFVKKWLYFLDKVS